MDKHVMLVDDDQDARELVSFFLEQAGYLVHSFNDGISALQSLQKHKYDLLILDIMMPQLSGFSVLKSVRMMRKCKNLPVIMLSGRRGKEDILKVQEQVSDYILKPTSGDDLINRVERLLGRPANLEKVDFDMNEAMAKGEFRVPIRVVSISNQGIVLFSAVALKKNFLIQNLSLALFQKLAIGRNQFVVSGCIPITSGGYRYFISFVELNPTERLKLSQWIEARRRQADHL